MITSKTRCDAKNVLRRSPVDDVDDVGDVSGDLASDVGVADVRLSFMSFTVDSASGQPLRVIGNEKLERVEFNHSIKFLHTAGYAWHPEVVTIRGNRKLSYSMIEEISQLFSTYRFFKPRVGECTKMLLSECSTPGLVTDLAQLNCRAYYGDIVPVDRTLVLELIIGLCFIIFSFMVTCVKVWTTD
ncbi:unnamed protein product [Heligmosomoides polygyrus]|uniref:Recep_L_domain domain-containing protein n=1 Tax=Heligmosomoides polygyrus TaxID=6339 RepID=A0A183FHU0_HELPZ|nr:unnamed protein product [Heligmosomoides polygyrus]